VLIRVAADEKTRSELMNVVDIFRAKIVDVSPKSFIVEVTGTQDKIDAMIELLRPIGIEEVVRTGKVAMARGMQGSGGAKTNPGERAA
jgi:acetolactate synthase I/III small subunit